jgi:hypothetical protein
MTSEYDDSKPLQANLEISNPETSVSSSEVIITTSVKVTSQARSVQKQGELSDA